MATALTTNMPSFSFKVLKRAIPTVGIVSLASGGTGGAIQTATQATCFQTLPHSITSGFTWYADAEI